MTLSLARSTEVTGAADSAALHSAIMAERFICNVCELPEEKCECDRYCGLCMGAHQVRLCQDGAYYCLECREACDLQAQN